MLHLMHARLYLSFIYIVEKHDSVLFYAQQRIRDVEKSWFTRGYLPSWSVHRRSYLCFLGIQLFSTCTFQSQAHQCKKSILPESRELLLIAPESFRQTPNNLVLSLLHLLLLLCTRYDRKDPPVRTTKNSIKILISMHTLPEKWKVSRVQTIRSSCSNRAATMGRSSGRALWRRNNRICRAFIPFHPFASPVMYSILWFLLLNNEGNSEI